MNRTNPTIELKLEQRYQQQLLRKLKPDDDLLDFCSNDYLGFARSDRLKALINAALADYPDYYTGSTGSRLISGNDDFTENLENEIAFFHHAQAGLIFNSGYDANVGLFSALPQRGDTIIIDELIHASVIDGARLSYANRYSFKHNDLDSLESKLRIARGTIYIAVESIYSMDGDEAPLKAILDLADQYEAYVIVDEAHATGIFGDQGRGLVYANNLQTRVFAQIVTFGKALGTHGAIVLGSHKLRSFLINFARSFIYSTAASFYSHLSVKMAYEFLGIENHQKIILEKINLFKSTVAQTGIQNRLVSSNSPIQCIVTNGNQQALALSDLLKNNNFDAKAILSPTVPAGKERLRICLHSFNDDKDIIKLANLLKSE